jgi:replication-associated recombination protein RarA
MTEYVPIRTKRGYLLGEVASALQKALRRGESHLAGYWAMELYASGYRGYLWKRLLTVSAEDCAGLITQEIKALYDSHRIATKGRDQDLRPCRVFVAKAVIILAVSKKSRDSDHLIHLVYEAEAIPAQELLADLEASKDEVVPIPEYAFDCHTMKGKRAGKTRKDFLKAEFEALNPRIPGLFDNLIK